MLINRFYWNIYFGLSNVGQARFALQASRNHQTHPGRRVRKMVAYAYQTVPYYRETLDRLGLGGQRLPER